MKRKFEAEYRAFASNSHIAIMLALFAVTCFAGYAFSLMIWQLTLIICPILSMGILCFMDYFTFSGTGSKRATGMDVVRSSYYGGEVLHKALKQDMINKSLFNLLSVAFAVGCVFVSRSQAREIAEANSMWEGFEDSNLFVIVYALGVFATSQILIRVTLLWTRSKGLTMQVHMLIVYLVFFGGTIILLPVIFLSETHSTPIMLAYAVVAECLSIFFANVLLKHCKKAYDSSFSDESIE